MNKRATQNIYIQHEFRRGVRVEGSRLRVKFIKRSP